MSRIVPAIASLTQHLETLRHAPEVYRPPICPHCGLGGLWSHGCYERKADRGWEPGERWAPIPIPRFFCQGCRQTCSRLPACIAPRRWYGWAVQQFVVQLLLVGCSLHRCACWVGLDRRTVGRWWDWLKERGDEFGLFLRSRFPELGRTVDFGSFWSAALAGLGLMNGMAWLDGQEVVVP